MKYKKLGSSGIDVSTICLGTMTWGCQNSEAEAHEQMDYAVEQDINFFDTAELYAIPPEEHTQGLTETYIGTWFAKRQKRDDIILASKITGPGFPYIEDGKPITPERIQSAFEGSLKRLKTDYIDLYQFHWPNYPYPHHGRHHAGDINFTETDSKAHEDNFLACLEYLNKLIIEGKIRSFGLSNDTPWGVMKYLEIARRHDLPLVTSVQNEYSLLYRHDEPYLAEVCAHENVAYLPWSPLAAGSLSGKYLGGERPEGARWSLGKDNRPNQRDTPAAQEAVKAYMNVAKKHGLDVCQMALAYCYQKDFVTSTIIGATTMEQLKSNIDAQNVTLSAEILKDIEDVNRQYPVPY
jgi:aryl-alcohol dehydrogenase-like predicted oxidoreductase